MNNYVQRYNGYEMERCDEGTYGILQAFQQTQNIVKSIAFIHTPHLPYHLKIFELLLTTCTSKRQIQLIPHLSSFILKTM